METTAEYLEAKKGIELTKPKIARLQKDKNSTHSKPTPIRSNFYQKPHDRIKRNSAEFNYQWIALKNQLDKEVDALVEKFEDNFLVLMKDFHFDAPEAITSPESNPTRENPVQNINYKSDKLPWFNHGVKGFINKLWLGNHPSNPMWKNYESLDAWNSISDAINEDVDYLIQFTLNEVKASDANLIQIDDSFKRYVNEFKNQLSQIVNMYMFKLYRLSKEFNRLPISKKEYSMSDKVENKESSNKSTLIRLEEWEKEFEKQLVDKILADADLQTKTRYYKYLLEANLY